VPQIKKGPRRAPTTTTTWKEKPHPAAKTRGRIVTTNAPLAVLLRPSESSPRFRASYGEYYRIISGLATRTLL